MLVRFVLPAEAAESRFSDVRLMVSRHGISFIRYESFEEKRGVLVSDTAARHLRFEADGRLLFDVPFDRLSAGRYEQSKYPPRSFRRSGHYLTLHYVGETGEPAFGVFRLPGGAVVDLLAAFERDTGMRVERGPAATSFLGLPVHLTVGTRVQVTDTVGARVRGTVVHLSSSTLDLGASGRFDVASVWQINVRDGLAEGVAAGTVATLLPAMLVTFADCLDECSRFGMLSARGWVIIGGGAAVGAVLDAGKMRQAYRRTNQRDSSRVQWQPVIGHQQKGVLVSLQF